MNPECPRQYRPLELEQEAARSLGFFVERRLAEGAAPYVQRFGEVMPLVEELFRCSGNLNRLDGGIFAEHPELIAPARFLTVPPLSEDDLDTLVGTAVAKRKHVDDKTGQAVARVIRSFVDPIRCPWLATKQPPDVDAVCHAVRWTAGVWAAESCRTDRRGEASRDQETRVAQVVEQAGATRLSGVRRIEALDTVPRGHFTSEVVLGGTKADLTVRLADGRLLAIECKVSNSALNSVKRLNRETAGKAERWRTTYGRQVLTVAVLSGVFRCASLVDAQQAGVFLFWEHDLTELGSFVRRNLA